MTILGRAHETLRQPEYTGENRCLPCTATNVVIALVLAAGLGLLWWPAGVAFLAGALLAIWLRGYLVPGTPELTKRYFPEWLLAKFDKAPARVAGDGAAAGPDDPPEMLDIDPERTLLEAGVVEPCADADDLCLTAAFETAWRERIAALRESGATRSALAEHLGLDSDDVVFEEYGDALVVEHAGSVSQWESRAALLADLAAARELPERVEEWDDLIPAARSQLLDGLRIFIETCPECDGPVALDTDVVESCCRSHEVITAGCSDCGARLLEVPEEQAGVA